LLFECKTYKNGHSKSVRAYDIITVDPVAASDQYFDSHYSRGSKIWWGMAEGENY